MPSHFAADLVAVSSVLAFGHTLSAAVVLPVISIVSLYTNRHAVLLLWAAATAWLATEASAEMQLPLQLLFTVAALQRCSITHRAKI